MEISKRIFYGKENRNSAQDELWKGRPVIKCEMLYSRMTLEQKDLVEALRIELRNKIWKVRELNHTNTALIQNSRNIVQATINIISSLAGGGDSRKRITYGAGGKLNSKHKGKVNLYNRKA
jgi:flagellar biosynthesis/type III secretory pathway chaperone